VDIKQTVKLLKQLNVGELKISVLKGDGVSPVAGIVEVIKRGYELIPPDRMHKAIIKYVKARLLDESLTFVCTNCWRYVAVMRIHDLDAVQCPECESKRIGAVQADEELVRREIRKVKSKKEGGVVKDAIKSAELVSNYDKAALVTLAGKGIKPEDASEILKEEGAVNEHLIGLIIESEKEVLKRRFYRRGKYAK
jgi:ATP-dependent Lhr-like helicase